MKQQPVTLWLFAGLISLTVHALVLWALYEPKKLGLGIAVTSTVNLFDPNQVAFDVIVQNVGETPLTSIKVKHQLTPLTSIRQSSFRQPSFRQADIIVGNDSLELAADVGGELVIRSLSLAPSEKVHLQIKAHGAGEFTYQLTGTANADGTVVSDSSDAGDMPDANGDGDANQTGVLCPSAEPESRCENDPLVVVMGEAAAGVGRQMVMDLTDSELIEPEPEAPVDPEPEADPIAKIDYADELDCGVLAQRAPRSAAERLYRQSCIDEQKRNELARQQAIARKRKIERDRIRKANEAERQAAERRRKLAEQKRRERLAAEQRARDRANATAEAQRIARRSESATNPSANSGPQGAAAAKGKGAGQGTNGYRVSLAKHLRKYQRYPRNSKRRREEGLVHITFVVSRSGKVLGNPQIRRSSTYARLDKEAIRMLQRAQPLPVDNEAFGQREKLKLTIPVRFRLQ